MSEIRIGFLRGIGFILSGIFVGLILGLFIYLIFFSENNTSDSSKPIQNINNDKCSSVYYKNGIRYCVK